MKRFYEENDVMQIIGKQSYGDYEHIRDDMEALTDAFQNHLADASFSELLANAYIIGAIRGKQMERKQRHREERG